MSGESAPTEVERTAPTALPAALRPPLALIAALGALTTVVIGILYAGHSAPGRVDRWFVDPTADAIGPPWRRLALAVDFLGEPAGAALLVVAVATACLLLRGPRAAVLAVAASGAAVGTTTLVKPLVGRTIHGEGNLSYPSGHTAFLTTLALVTALLATGRLGLGRAAGTALALGAALAAGAAMGWAQVSLSAHYPTDVLGGWCTALAVVPATAWLVDRAADAGPRPRR
ncbi:phosphatase PAP2 family protein [Streptomyces sp. G45]|uniref:phosphatase PAP2 family protein n=1 Tax=Streptomyces sp. G45 TaxID=3406627 RepID=UPI003C21DC32